MKQRRNYRDRIYPSYTSLYTPEAVALDERSLKANARSLMVRIGAWLPADRDAACLDVACGAGSLLFALHGAGYKNICGVDHSVEQVSIARQICAAVDQGDAIAYLKQYIEKFTLITAFDIIEHFQKDEIFSFLDAALAALKPGGRLILQTPNADSPWCSSVRYGDFTHEVAFTPQSLARVLKVIGFVDYEASECPPYMHGLLSGVRALLWHVVRSALIIWNLIETGTGGSGVLTRVFITKADKPL